MGNIFNPKTKENTGYGAKEEITPVSPEKLIIAASGSLLVGGALKLAGKHKTASLISKFALPLLALGCYRKFTSNDAI
ncbi:hypothetical protein [Flavobacterium chilense]|uniref:PrgI family protein n=1 Tax=Flavobacterium chilense TaxID=946677 RepID=A0A1M7L9I1_9FLAO|nr:MULTISPECIES: hypothetical protein [Flavobacterium]SHM74645.1 hypothetical protein SAMN05444484_10911 [Flavobacterium chilense]